MNIELYQTSKYRGDRLTSQGVVPEFGPVLENDGVRSCDKNIIYIDEQSRFQHIEGIGGAMTDAAAWTLLQMPEHIRGEVLESFFAPAKGGGYNIVRISMNSCDFSRRNYSCCDTPEDFGLKNFNINYDLEAVVPVLKEALKLCPDLKVLISPWSPPAWMKTNNDMNHGGKLRSECRQVWADFFCRYIEALRGEGIPVWALTVNNEPNASQLWDSLVISAEEECEFVRDYLGPTLHRNGLQNIKVMIWDHNRDYMYNRAAVIYRDPEAAKYVWGTAYHWYDDNCYDNVMLTHDAFPDKKLFFSEGCNGGNNYFDPEWGDTDTSDPNGIFIHWGIWEAGERYARNMIMDFNRHCCGWLDWNMVLNEKGGPRHLPNGCGAPYIYDTVQKTLHPQNSLYYIGHFSHFVLPGARRIAVASSKNALETTAFINPDGSIAVIILNRTEESIPFYYYFQKQRAAAEIPARSIQTMVINI